jgi:hypothetical protein
VPLLIIGLAVHAENHGRLTNQGRAALSAYTQALRDLLGGLDIDASPAPSSTTPAATEGRRRAASARLPSPSGGVYGG